jgi:two-component system, response regulator, stage 0 sporulation protein F
MMPARRFPIDTRAPIRPKVWWSGRPDEEPDATPTAPPPRPIAPRATRLAVDARPPGPILVVDDDRGLREALVGLLEDEGHAVIAAGDGRAALQAIQISHPSLVLLDMRMPGLNGWDLARELTQRGITLPIVVMTAARDAAAWAAEIGAVAYLAKPFDLPELLDIVERLLDRPPS